MKLKEKELFLEIKDRIKRKIMDAGLHGVPILIQAKSILTKIVWSIFVITAFILCFLLISESIVK